MAKIWYENRKDSKGKPFRYCKIGIVKDGLESSIGVGRSKTKRDEKRDNKYLSLIEQLEVIQITGENLDLSIREEIEQVQDTDPKFITKVVAAGLLHKKKSTKTVKELFDAHFEHKRGDTKDRSTRSYRDDQRAFERFVGSNEQIKNITKGTVIDFISDCKKQRCRNPRCTAIDKSKCKCKKTSYAKSTIGLKLKRVRTAFAYAVDKQWMTENPIQYDAKQFKQKVDPAKQKEQARILTPENVQRFLNHQEADYERQLWKTVIYYLGCRPAELAIMRWSDVDFDPEDPTITFRSKDTEHTGRDRENMPTRTSPLWNEIYDLLKKWRDLHPDEKFIFNDIFNLRHKPEFEVTNTETCEQIREGRYESNFNTSMRKMIKRSGIPVYPQPHKALRDVRINELERLGFRRQEIDAWIGNSEAVRDKHYSATSVTKADRQKALEITQKENRVRQSENRVRLGCDEDTQTDPNQLIQQLSKSVKDRELLEVIQKALIQADSGELEIAEKYTRRMYTKGLKLGK